MSFNLRVLKAEHGDAFIIGIGDELKTHHIVVDGGPSSKFCIDKVVKELKALPYIDLMVLTHFDDDHIAGLIDYIKAFKNYTLPVKAIWANCSKEVVVNTSPNISYPQANTLDKILNEYCNKQALERNDNINNTLDEINLDFCKIQVLSPTTESLRINREQYVEKLNKMKKIASTRVDGDAEKSIEELAQRKHTPCKDGVDVVNRSSIAFTIEAEGKTVLMMGDADPDIVGNKIKALEQEKKQAQKVDLMKVSHHGSRQNISNDLLDAIDCYNFLFPTNGGFGSSYHPDRETLAKVLCHPGRDNSKTVNLYFNYPLSTIEKRTGKLLTEEEINRYNCNIIDDIDCLPIS